jgi:GH25 family lysozyme M1 (1,4-beta-N-acetylmuramidase)
MPVEEPDVSNWQGRVDWAAEKRFGVDLAGMKASEDGNFVDPTFAYNWAQTQANEMKRIAYHFAQPGHRVQDEVGLFRRVVGPLGPDDHIAMDLEARGSLGGAAVPQWGLDFCRECEQQFQVGADRIMVYTGRWFIDGTGGPGAWQILADRYPDGYWFSAYTGQLVLERLLPWTRCAMWQNTDASRHPGVNGVCDGNLVQNGGYFTHAPPTPARPGRSYPSIPFEVGGQPMAVVPVELTTDPSGHYCAAVDLPPGCTRVVDVSLDMMSVYAGNGWDPADKVFAHPAVGNPHLDHTKQGEFYVVGPPNHFYTGNVTCA